MRPAFCEGCWKWYCELGTDFVDMHLNALVFSSRQKWPSPTFLSPYLSRDAAFPNKPIQVPTLSTCMRHPCVAPPKQPDPTTKQEQNYEPLEPCTLASPSQPLSVHLTHPNTAPPPSTSRSEPQSIKCETLIHCFRDSKGSIAPFKGLEGPGRSPFLSRRSQTQTRRLSTPAPHPNVNTTCTLQASTLHQHSPASSIGRAWDF